MESASITPFGGLLRRKARVVEPGWRALARVSRAGATTNRRDALLQAASLLDKFASNVLPQALSLGHDVLQLGEQVRELVGRQVCAL